MGKVRSSDGRDKGYLQHFGGETSRETSTWKIEEEEEEEEEEKGG